MVLLNQVTREIIGKIVYYGPGLCGKTTNLQFVYDYMEQDQKGKMLSLATETDRTLFFDFLPVDLGRVKGFKVRIQLYTVPGQVFYEETRKRVLKGADGVVFVADSQSTMLEANKHSLEEMGRHLVENGLDPEEIPVVIQYNKRDLKDILSVEELDEELNPDGAPFYEAVAVEGVGVEETLKAISKLVLHKMMGKTVSKKKWKEGASREESRGPTGVVMNKAKLLNELGVKKEEPQEEEPEESVEADEGGAADDREEAIEVEGEDEEEIEAEDEDAEEEGVEAEEEESETGDDASGDDPAEEDDGDLLSIDSEDEDLLNGQAEEEMLGDDGAILDPVDSVEESPEVEGAAEEDAEENFEENDPVESTHPGDLTEVDPAVEPLSPEDILEEVSAEEAERVEAAAVATAELDGDAPLKPTILQPGQTVDLDVVIEGKLYRLSLRLTAY